MFLRNQSSYMFFALVERTGAAFLREILNEATAVLLPECWDLVACPEDNVADACNDDGEDTSEDDRAEEGTI
jgi:hypothetical protein